MSALALGDPGPDLGGVLLAADGVSYGDGVGADGDFVTLRACETMDPQLGDCAYNMPSPVNAIQIDYLLGSTGYLTFYPPISRLSFRVCYSQSHALAAWDSIGNLIVPDTVGPSNGSSLGGDLYCDPEGWEEFEGSAAPIRSRIYSLGRHDVPAGGATCSSVQLTYSGSAGDVHNSGFRRVSHRLAFHRPDAPKFPDRRRYRL